MHITALQLHKKASGVFDKIQDSFDINPANFTMALADGATQGYRSGAWAKLLTSRFVESPSFNLQGFSAELVPDCQAAYKEVLARETPDKHRTVNILRDVKKEEGAYATFLGIQLFPEGICKAVSCGDSNIFVYAVDGSFTGAWPHTNFQSLQEDNTFLYSRQLSVEIPVKATPQFFEFNFTVGDSIYLMTDAMSRHLFADMSRIRTLAAINSFDEFLAFATENWSAGRLEEDDLSLVRLRTDQPHTFTVEQLIPTKDFVFENREEIDLTNTVENNEWLSKKQYQQEIKSLTLQLSSVEAQLRVLKLASQTVEPRKIHSLVLVATLLFIQLISIGITAYDNARMKAFITSINTRLVHLSPKQYGTDRNKVGKTTIDKKFVTAPIVYDMEIAEKNISKVPAKISLKNPVITLLKTRTVFKKIKIFSKAIVPDSATIKPSAESVGDKKALEPIDIHSPVSKVI